MPRYKDVDVNHPAIVSSIKKMHSEGRSREDIMRIVGMPAEVVRRHSEVGAEENKKKK